MPPVTMPDGTPVQFPDDMPPDQIKSMILSKFPDANNPPAPLATPVPGYVPGQPMTPDQQAAFAANWGKTNSGSMPPEVQPPADVIPAPLRAFSTNAVESVPVLGAMAHNSRSPMMQAIDARAAQQAPAAATAGSVFGNVAPFVVGGEIPGIAKILGMDAAMGLPAQVGASMGSMTALNAADATLRGESPGQIVESAGLGTVAGAAGPLAGKVIGAGLNKAGALLQGIAAPTDAAGRIVGNAGAKDINAGNFLNSQDEANAALNGQPLINADRYGQNVQTLARTAANLDPTAKQALSDTLQNRFLTQNDRAKQFIGRLTNGQTDAIAAQQAAEAAGRAANIPAYKTAYSDPAAQAIFTPEIGQLMGAPPFQKAIRAATATGATDSALNGFPPVKNPFRFNSDGSYTLTTQPDGSTATPSLQFWDQVQRNLRNSASVAARNGDNLGAMQNGQLRTALNNVLDTTVPAFNTARSGAAAAFGAEDALQAGKNFVNMPSNQVPAAIAAHANFTPQEKKLFGTGFANDLLAKVAGANDRTNVINNVFASPQARAQIQTAFSPFTSNADQQLEHFMRIEDTMQGTKQAVQGGSNTAAQLAAAGALTGYGTGAVQGGWNPLNWTPDTWRNAGSAAGLGAAGRYGAKMLGASVDQKVLGSVAQMLSSKDPQVIDQVVQNAMRSSKTATAIKAIQHGIQLAGQGAGAAVPAALAPPAAPDTTLTPPGLGL